MGSSDLLTRMKKALTTGKVFTATAAESEEFKKMIANYNPTLDKETLTNLLTELHPPGFNYLGPGTNVKERIAGEFSSSIPSSLMDAFAMKHDLYYMLKDPLARQKADNIFIEEVKSVIFSKGALSTRVGALAILLGFVAKSKLEAKGVSLGAGLSGDPAFLGTATDENYKSIETEYKRFRTIMDSAGYTLSLNDRFVRPTAAGVTEETKVEYSKFRDNLEFLFTDSAKDDTEKTNEDDEGSVLFTPQDFNNFTNIQNKTFAMSAAMMEKKKFVDDTLDKIDSGDIILNRDILERLIGAKITINQLTQLSQSHGFGNPGVLKASIVQHIITSIARKETEESTDEKTYSGKAEGKESKDSNTEGKDSNTEGKEGNTEGKDSNTEGKEGNTEGKTDNTEGKTGNTGNTSKAGNTLFTEETVGLPTMPTIQSTDIPTTDFDALGFSVVNADSKEAVAEIKPAEAELKESNRLLALENTVTSSLWRAFDSSMNQDMRLRHRVKFGGELFTGSYENHRSTPAYRASPAVMRNVLYNRKSFIPKYQPLINTLEPIDALNRLGRHDTYNNARVALGR
jgi:hypothetical protein